MDFEQQFRPRISWSDLDHEYNGYAANGELVRVSEEAFVDRWNEEVEDMVRDGIPRHIAEKQASLTLCDPELWR